MSEEPRATNLGEMHDDLVAQMRLIEGTADFDEGQQELAQAWRMRLEEVRRRAEAPLNVAFVAQVGRGKSSMIAAATGLRLDVEGSPRKWSVLPVGDGRTTLGETSIVLENRDDISLEVDPVPSAELTRELQLLASDSWAAAEAGKPGPRGELGGEELYKLLRRWLVPEDGDRRAAIAELARASESADALFKQLVTKLDLDSRTRRFERNFTTDARGLTELQQLLAQLMRGELPDAPAPRATQLRIPAGPLGEALSCLIDTRGIDSDAPELSIAGRRDLRKWLEHPDTLLVICSEYESAPDLVSRKLIEELRKLGERGLRRTWRLVIVDRREHDPDLDERRERELARDERLAECRDHLRRAEIELGDDVVVALDARREVEELREFLLGLGRGERAQRTSEWERVYGEAKHAMRELEEIEFATQARELDLRLWWIWDQAFGQAYRFIHYPDGLMSVSLELKLGDEIGHWSHLYAATRRRGRYSKLDLAAIGGQAAASLPLGPYIRAINAIRQFATNAKLPDRLILHLDIRAHQFSTAWLKLFEELSERWRMRLEEYFDSDASDDLWRWCENRWGQGSGYVQAIADRFEQESERAKLSLRTPALPRTIESRFPPRPQLFRLRKIALQNFRSVEERTIHLTPTVTAIVGDNGLGKTGWLEAAAAAIGALIPGMGAGPAPSLHPSDMRQLISREGGVANRRYQRPLSITVEATLQGRRLSWRRRVEQPPQDGALVEDSPHDEDALHQKAREIAAEIGKDLQGETVRQLPVLAYYGTQRLWPTDVSAEDERHEVGSRLDGYRDCLQAASTHEHMLKWMRKYTQVDLQRQARKGEPVTQLRAVEQAVVSGIPEAKSFYYDFDLEDLVLETEDGETLPFRLLSDGYRNIVAMVADIAWRASRLNPQLGAAAPALAEGVVLIDEIDLHLHPRWQRRILGDLRRAFPRLQFVVTTHSPFIVQSLEAGQLVNLDTDAQEVDYVDLSPEDITEQVMGVEQPQRSERRRREAQVARRYYELLERMPEADELELARLESELDELTAPHHDNQAFVVFLELKRAQAREARQA